MTETPTGRLHKLLSAMAIEGMDAPTVRDLVTPAIPLGDAEFWMRTGVDKEIRRFFKDAGLVLDHHAEVEDGAGAPAAVWIQLSLDEVVTHIQHVRKQIAEDEAALEHRLEVWCSANPEAGMTPSALRAMADAA